MSPPHTLPVEARNQWFQRVEALKRNRGKRHREGLFVVEGVRSLNALAASPRWEVEAYLFAAGRDLSAWAREQLRASRAQTHLEVHPELMDELSDKEDGSEILGVVRIPRDDPAALPAPRATPLYVILDEPSLPGNLGSMVRSCDALGVDGALVFGHAADLYDPQTVRAAAGSLFSLPVTRVSRWDTLLAWLDGLRLAWPGLAVLGTSARGGSWPDEVDLAAPAVLLFGNETVGLRPKLARIADAQLSIPMSGSASSLNVVSAATAVLYEAARQRRSTHR